MPRAPMSIHWSAIFAALVLAGVQYVLFLRGLHRRTRNDEIVCALCATSPQTICRASYTALNATARKEGIEPHVNRL